jgi:predicted nuclease of restriction endonuclease-like (RecB) superfamily
MQKDEIMPRNYGSLLDRIAAIFTQARTKAMRDIDLTQVMAYFEIGKEIVEFDQAGKRRAGYGEELIVKLAKDMTARLGRGFSERNLRNMRAFYLTFPIRQTASAELENRIAAPAHFTPSLSWSHYCELLKVDEPLARSFYEKECSQNNWSVRELKRQINAMLFERLALSKDSRAVMRMAKEGQIVEQPEDAIKDPYTESQLEQALIDKLQSFLLELGKGFSFVARQKRITIANRHYYIDLVFYNRLLRCFVLIDLKRGEFDHADAGQMNFYLNYYRENEKQADENDPIGLILCAGKDDLFARYVLGGLTNKVFASKYKLALPSEKELRKKLTLLNKAEPGTEGSRPRP